MTKKSGLVTRSLLVFAMALWASVAQADGTETLGDPSIELAEGTGVLVAGTGLQNNEGTGGSGAGTISLTVPDGTSVEQVLLYWSGESPVGSDDTIIVDGIEITGDNIGGPTLFFGDFDGTAFRADITDLGLVSSGDNVLSVDGLFFDAPPFDVGNGNHGAGLLVIVNDGGATSDIGLKDGIDWAFCGFAEPRKSTVPQTYDFVADDVDRTADLSLFVGSVGNNDPVRPNFVQLTLSTDVDPPSTFTLVDELDSSDGDLWDTLVVPVTIPAGATMLTVELGSGTADGGCPTDPLAASLTWVAAALSVPAPPPCGDGIVVPPETCDPPGTVPDSAFPDNLCRATCTYCGDGIVNNGEECDFNDPDAPPFCTDMCELPDCGDGIVVPPETCDPPGTVPDSAFPDNLCRATCTYCGDGIVNNGEECDFNDPDAPPSCTDMCELICGLQVAKTCELPPPPAAPEGKCAGKLQEYTVIWNGTGDIDISIGDGLTGLMTSSSSGTQATVQPGEEVTFFTDGSTNDTIVTIAGLGTSTFHVSCSDKDMDGDTTTNEDQQQVSSFGRDCGKDQGDGKGDSGVNTWLLEGFRDDDGAVLDCTTGNGAGDTVCEFNAIPVSCDTVGTPSNLTFVYTGGGCPGNNSQGSKSDCSGSIDPSQPVTVRLDGGTLGTVSLGESFVVPTTGSNTTIRLSNSGGTQTNDVHTSCSAPLVTDDVFGSLTLVGLDGLGIGTPVTYSYVVTNEGDTEVTGIVVTDDQLGEIGTIASLQPGKSETLTADAFISETTTNVATVDGDGAPGAECLADSNPVTVEVLSPPPCSVAIAFEKLEDDKIKWEVTNNSAFGAATLQTFTLDFPDGFDFIKKVKLDGDIYKATDSNLVVGPGDTIGEDDWTEDKVEKRQIELGKTETLEVEFEEKDENASPADFTLDLTFEEGCNIIGFTGDANAVSVAPIESKNTEGLGLGGCSATRLDPEDRFGLFLFAGALLLWSKRRRRAVVSPD